MGKDHAAECKFIQLLKVNIPKRSKTNPKLSESVLKRSKSGQNAIAEKTTLDNM